jgi:hypothetical protein
MDPVNTFTDYYAQGQSFKGAPHFLHFHVDKGSPWTKANLLVPISRAATWSDVKLAHPLWNAGDSDKRAAIIKSMSNALAPKPAYVAELARLQECHQNTYNMFYDNLMNAHDDMDVDDDEPLATAPVLPTVRNGNPPTTTAPTRNLQTNNDTRRQVWEVINLLQMTSMQAPTEQPEKFYNRVLCRLLTPCTNHRLCLLRRPRRCLPLPLRRAHPAPLPWP